MIRRRLSMLALVGAGAAACQPATALDRTQAPIINGHACEADEEPETVALIVDGTVGFMGQEFPVRALMCTGTLIAPDVVLTAAHCLDPLALTFGLEAEVDVTYYVSREADLSALAAASEELVELPADAAPAARTSFPEEFDLAAAPEGGLGNFYDVGLLFLAAPLDGVPLAIVATPEEAEALAVGHPVTIAGWGQRSPDDSMPPGFKHCAATEIYELASHEMQIGDQPETSRKCHGDSGGPTFAALDGGRRVVGITSRAYDESDCEKGGVDTRADAWYAWLDAQLRAGCADGSRAWCEVEGVLTPEDVEGEGDGDGDEDSGGCAAAGGGSSAFVALALASLAVVRRRRRVA